MRANSSVLICVIFGSDQFNAIDSDLTGWGARNCSRGLASESAALPFSTTHPCPLEHFEGHVRIFRKSVLAWPYLLTFSHLECGILAQGFARVRCGGCGHDFLIAFSCKGRSVCPSCNTRRMAETAAHLVDQVFPQVPVRQWVLSLPKRLRYFPPP
jgi:hypothetical protein